MCLAQPLDRPGPGLGARARGPGPRPRAQGPGPRPGSGAPGPGVVILRMNYKIFTTKAPAGPAPAWAGEEGPRPNATKGEEAPGPIQSSFPSRPGVLIFIGQKHRLALNNGPQGNRWSALLIKRSATNPITDSLGHLLRRNHCRGLQLSNSAREAPRLGKACFRLECQTQWKFLFAPWMSRRWAQTPTSPSMAGSSGSAISIAEFNVNIKDTSQMSYLGIENAHHVHHGQIPLTGLNAAPSPTPVARGPGPHLGVLSTARDQSNALCSCRSPCRVSRRDVMVDALERCGPLKRSHTDLSTPDVHVATMSSTLRQQKHRSTAF